jgi:cephalosporin-C deacetylase-like acetyl esterase
MVSSGPIYRVIRKYCAYDEARTSAILSLLELFDPVNHASRIKVPIWLSAGGRDPSVKREAVERVFKAVACTDKHLEYFPEAGHVFVPEMNLQHARWIGRLTTAPKEV